MSDPVVRVQALIAKALSTHSEEEARTCALSAVKIIVKEKLVVCAPEDPKMAAAREGLRGSVKRPPGATHRRPPADAPSRTGYDTACLFCGKNLPAGSKVFWSKVFNVMVCPECFEAEILVKTRMDDVWEKGR